jgi:hypothetical protein
MKLNLIFKFLILSVLIISCNKHQNDEIRPVSSNSENSKINSFQFHDSIVKNIYFSNENFNKDFIVTDLLVSYYKYDSEKMEAYIYCLPYNPTENKFLVGNPIKAKDILTTLNGKKMNQFVYDDYEKDSHPFLIYLENPKDLKRLKIFDSSENYSGIPSDFKKEDYRDLITISGQFAEVKDGYIIFNKSKIN